MGIADFVLIILIAAAFVAAAAYSHRRKGCCGGCKGCSACGEEACRDGEKRVESNEGDE